MHSPDPRWPGDDPPSGFTLIELLTVLAVMLIILSITVIAVIDWARATGMRASTAAVEAGLIGTTNRLRRGIAFHADSDREATFTHRGSVAEGGRRFILTEPHRGERALSATVEVYGVTGHTEVSR